MNSIMYYAALIVSGMLSKREACQLNVLTTQEVIQNKTKEFSLNSSLIWTTDKNNASTTLVQATSDYMEVTEVGPEPKNATTPGTWIIYVCYGKEVGSTVVTAETVDVEHQTDVVYLHVNVCKLRILDVLSDVVGWIYFVTWSLTLYPQMYLNFVRKSVVGLNFDYVVLGVVGFATYSMFNLGLYYVPEIQRDYSAVHPKGIIPVFANDVLFGLHSLVINIILVIQCCIYESKSQSLSFSMKILMIIYAVLLMVTGTLAVKYPAFTWLEFLNCCNAIKLSTTAIKYVPQAYMNYRRKSTKGWSIVTVFFDFTGGAFSILQMLIKCYNYDDWASLKGNSTKFGVGVLSSIYSLILMYQHFCLYRHNDMKKKWPGGSPPSDKFPRHITLNLYL